MKVKINSRLIISEATPEQKQKIIQDNTYQNPEYQNAVNMNRSTHGIDQTIKTYDFEGNNLVVPRGYLGELPENEQVDNSATVVADIPNIIRLTARDYQATAIQKALDHIQGILCSGTGSGKTFMGLSIIAKRQQKTLILVHSKELMMQWREEIKKLLGIECGLIGGGKNTQNDITICMLQTLNKRPELLQELSQNYGLVLVDECHHIPSKTFANVINQLACKYRYGLTATPHRRDGLHQLINRHIGPIVHQVDDKAVHSVGGMVPITVKRIDTNKNYYVDTWNEYIEKLTSDNDRNRSIIEIARGATDRNIPTLILTDRVSHAETLSNLSGDGLLIHGQLPTKIRKERMQSIPNHLLTIGTTGLLGEGLDIKGWTALILATPISSRVKLLQAVGRVMRTHKNKDRGYVADLVDECGFSKSSFYKRQAIYQEKKFSMN